METRSHDCGSMITDMIQNLAKLIKNGDMTQRIAGLHSLQLIVLGAGTKIGDCHNDIVKIAGKYISDKSIEVKILIANVIEVVSINSNGCTTVSAEVLLAPAAKGLEDDVAIVQDVFANTFATIFYQQIRTHAEGLQQAKIGLARGETGEAGKINISPKKTTISKLKELSASVTSTKRGVDEQDFRSIIQHFNKNIYKSNGTLRAGYICSLSYLIKMCLQSISHDELEWLVLNCIAMFKDPAIVLLSYEDMAYFRARISHLLRTSILMNLNEIQQLKYATLLVQFVSTDTENRNDSELQLALGELSHAVTILGQAAVSISDDINGAATIYLRHAAFGVRTAAAYVLASLATVAPAIAAGFLRNSLITAQTQTKQLSVLDADETSKNKGIRDAERLQRMYFFHGHTLVIAIFLKNENSFPTGLPKDLIFDIFNFGLALLENNVLSSPPAIRHVVCSIVRAGSLIVSSCLNMGQTITYQQNFALLKQCQNILNVSLSTPVTASSATPSQDPSSNGAGDDLLYEVMCLEAALVCISTLLWSTPEALINDSECLTLVVNCLDSAFQAVKNKYQSKYRTHFRFRTLHTILLECFAWLPPGSFPDSSQAVFVESLRVFRDSINAGYESTCLGDFVSNEFKMFGSFSGQPTMGKATVLQPETPNCESLLILKLENNAVALQKKESEAFLATFSTDNRSTSDSSRNSLQVAVEWSQPAAPVAQIDSRTINASIALLAATFGHQDNECQEKAVQLCSQAMSQITKSNNSSSISMFSSEEEKRKRDKKNFVTIKNVVTALCAIIKSFSLPLSMSMNSSLSWGQVLADRLFEVLTYSSVEIRCAAAISLGVFAGKVAHTSLLETASGLINDAVTTAIEKKENLGELSGYLIALSSLSTITSASKASTKRSIVMTLFECLRKVDSPSLFRAHGLLAVALVVKGMTQVNENDDNSETYAMLERTCHLIELQLVSITGIDEVELLCAAIQRTVNATIVVVCNSLSVIGSTNNKEKELLIDIRNRLHKVWEVIKKTSCTESVRLETVEYIVHSFHPSFGPLKDEEITLLLKEEISNKELKRNKILIAAVEGIRLVSKKNPNIVLKEEIDISLFELLDWCIAATEASTNSAYAGLELRSNSSSENILGDITILQKLVEIALEDLSNFDVDDSLMDQRVGRWLLFCRAVALGVRTGGNDEKQGEEAEGGREGEDDGGGEFGADEVHVDVAVSKNTDGDVLLANRPWTYIQYVSWCRDQASKRCQNLTAARVKIRAAAIKYGTSLLSKLNHTALHKDMRLARETIKSRLQSFGPSPSEDDLSTLPCYLSLIIHDIITMSCACLTYTIEDKYMIQLQTESVLLIRKVTSLFCESIDPDVVGSSEDLKPGSNRILMQYMSQLVSAIRQCLTVSWCPVLQLSTYMIICYWIQEGFLVDKVIIRRLLKTICERFESAGEAITSRAPISLDVSESTSTVDHVIGCTVVGRLFLMSKKGVNGPLESQVQSTVLSMIEVIVTKLHSIWFAISTDAARILQNRDEVATDEHVSMWTTGNQDVDCRRGGITYCANAEPEKMKAYFEWALPNVLAALALSPSITSEEVLSVFAMSMATLEHYNSSRNKKLNDTIALSNDGNLLVIVTLASLAKTDTNRVIPTAQWVKVFWFINECLLPSTQQIFANGNQMTDLIIQTLSLINNLMDHFSGVSVAGELSSWIFITSLNIVRLLFPSVFAEASNGYSIVKYGNIMRSNYKKNDLILFETILAADRNMNGSMQILSSLFSIIVQCAGDINTVYIMQLFTAIVPLAAIASVNENSSRKELLRNIILDNIRKLIKDKLFEEEQLYALLGEDLLIWHEIFVVENSSESIQNVVIESILEAWHRLSSTSTNMTPLEYILPQICILIHQSNKGSNYCRLALVCLLRMMQNNTEKTGPSIMNAILPSLLSILDSNMDENYELVVVQIIFFAFNLVEESKRDELVALILLPLINVMSKRSNNSMTTQFLGKCLTHLARTYQETFRLQVSLLNDTQRLVLQEAMRNVLQQQQQQQLHEQNQQNGSSSLASIKKIDLNKFKK